MVPSFVDLKGSVNHTPDKHTGLPYTCWLKLAKAAVRAVLTAPTQEKVRNDYKSWQTSQFGVVLFSRRDVAQPGSALEWGSRGRRFKSFHPDQRFKGIHGNMNSLFSFLGGPCPTRLILRNAQHPTKHNFTCQIVSLQELLRQHLRYTFKTISISYCSWNKISLRKS